MATPDLDDGDNMWESEETNIIITILNNNAASFSNIVQP